MASPEWPKFEFKDGRKRMTLPIVDVKRNEARDPITPMPIRLNSTESALKKRKSEGETPAIVRSVTSLRKKPSKGGGWMSKECTQKELKQRRSIDSRPETLPETVPDSMPESLPQTVPEKSGTAGGRASMEVKKKSGEAVKAIDSAEKSGEEKENKSNYLLGLPDPLSELMLEREVRVMREEEELRKKKEEGNKAAAAVKPVDKRLNGGRHVVTRGPKKENRSIFFPSKKKPIDLQRRASLDGLLDPMRRTSRGDETILDMMEKSTEVRRASISLFGRSRDGNRAKSDSGRKGKGEEKSKQFRRVSDAGASSEWIAPSLQDFRPSSKQGRRSGDGGKEKDPTVPVTRKLSSVVPATPMGSEKGGSIGSRRVSRTSAHLVSPTASDFIPKNGRKKMKRMTYFGEKMYDTTDDQEEKVAEGKVQEEKVEERKVEEKEDEKMDEAEMVPETISSFGVKPRTQLSWGRLASAIFRKTSVGTEVSIGSTVPGEFDEEEVAMEREQERMNSITSLNSGNNEQEVNEPVVNRFISSISLATTRGPSSTGSVVRDSLEEVEAAPRDGFTPMLIDDESPNDDFEIKDTVQEGAPKEMKYTKPPTTLGLFRRPAIPTVSSEGGRPSSVSPPPSRHSSGGSTTGNPRGRRQAGVNYEDRLTRQLENTLALKRSDRTLLKHDNSSVASTVLNVEEERSSGWGVSLVAHSRGHVLLPSATAPLEGTSVRVALPLSCVLDSVAVAPTVL